jgi:hypothetical protein
MKSLLKRAPLLLTTILAAGALTVFAKSSPTFDIHTSVISKAAQSEKGVILVLTERGQIAAEAAYLLLAQVKQNEGYAPLFLAVDNDKIAGYKTALNLPEASLPAVIFFSKSGKEIARVVSAKSAMVKYAHAQEGVS